MNITTLLLVLAVWFLGAITPYCFFKCLGWFDRTVDWGRRWMWKQQNSGLWVIYTEKPPYTLHKIGTHKYVTLPFPVDHSEALRECLRRNVKDQKEESEV